MLYVVLKIYLPPTGVCRLERPAVVAAVSAHDDLAAQLLQALDQLDLLLGQHPGHKGVNISR